jgi:hypothetical protein
VSTIITWRFGAKIERLNHVQCNHVHTFYIHNIHGWSKYFALLHVMVWTWTKIEGQIISIIDDWCKEVYCVDLERI